MLQIALDAMGADNGVEPVVCGLLQALQNRNFKAYLVGDTALLKTSLNSKISQVIYCNALSYCILIIMCVWKRKTNKCKINAQPLLLYIRVPIQLVKNNKAVVCSART